MSVTLKNPHSILAVLETRPKDILQLNLPAHSSDGIWAQVEQKAKAQGIRSSGGAKGGRAGTSEALVKEREPLVLEELFLIF